MRYSIQDEDLNRIIQIETEVSENIEQLYNEYADNIIKWGKKFNSELVYGICKKSLGTIDEEYIQAMNNFVNQYPEMGMSFESISKHYKVGEDALGKIRAFQNDILEKALAHNAIEIQYACDGNAQYSNELISEYNDISAAFLSKIEASYDEYYSQAIIIRNENLLGDGIDILIKYQYETLQKLCVLYDNIFEMFLEWYEKTLRENESLLDELNQQMLTKSVDMGEEGIEKILSQIMDEAAQPGEGYISASSSTKTSNNGSDKEVNQVEKSSEARKEEIRQSSKEATSKSVDSLLKELDTPEKIRNFKGYIGECQRKFDECNAGNDKEAEKSKFKQFCEFVKKGAKKYAKPAMKALGIVLPLLAPEGHIVTQIAKNLPAVMECFSGLDNKESDKDKIELGLECMKSIGVDKFPEDGESIKKHIEQNDDSIAKDILKKILNSEKYMKVLDIDGEELSKPDNQKLYKEATGKDPVVVPQKRKAYSHDFERYNPTQLKNLSPIETEEKSKKIAGDIAKGITNITDENKEGAIFDGVDDVRKQIKSGTGYVSLGDNSELKRLIEELRNIVNGQLKDEVLPNVEGRYNKQDMAMLCEELEREKKIANELSKKPDYCNACQNFMRRQLGYPAEYEKLTVKELEEMIPILNKRCKIFSVDNKGLIRDINNAQNFINSKNSNIKKKRIANSVSSKTLGLGTYIGIGASILMASLWPLGVLMATAPLCLSFTDDGASSYGYLLSVLGEERTEILLRQYNNVDGNCYQLIDE